MIAATVFFRDDSGSSTKSVPAGLFDAHDLIKEHIGKGTVVVHIKRERTSADPIVALQSLHSYSLSHCFVPDRLRASRRRWLARLSPKASSNGGYRCVRIRAAAMAPVTNRMGPL